MEEAIQKLLHGFRNFKNFYCVNNPELYDEIKRGQRPKVLIIACSDSRVDPAIITNSDPGDIFVIRNVANLIPPYQPDQQYHGVSAALEYAVGFLEVKHIIILGHSDCGGIRALMERDENVPRKNEFLDQWLDLALPAKLEVNQNLQAASEATRHRACEEASLVLALENLLTFPWIKTKVDSKELAIHGWYFHIKAGQLFEFDWCCNEFKKISL